MAGTLVVSMAGLSQLELKVQYLKTAARQGLKAGVSEAAGLFEAEAKDLVPVLTGNLRDHIHTETVTDTDEVQTLAVTPVEAAANPYGFDPPYARRIELGFVGTDSLGRHYHQAAQPYMAPAFENKRDEAQTAIKEGVYSSLDAAMNTVAGKR